MSVSVSVEERPDLAIRVFRAARKVATIAQGSAFIRAIPDSLQMLRRDLRRKFGEET
jgi:hypothetical protein